MASTGVPSKINESNIAQFERAALEQAKTTVLSIRSAIKSWNSSKKKSSELRSRFVSYRNLHEDLVNWIKAYDDEDPSKMKYFDRLARLSKFARICKSYHGG